MPSNHKPANYYSGCNQRLLRLVPGSARRILEVGCGEGNLGAELKKRRSSTPLASSPCQGEDNGGVMVFGIERDPAAAGTAASRLDQVFTIDIEQEDPPIEPGTID